jgi:hypothetical protein
VPGTACALPAGFIRLSLVHVHANILSVIHVGLLSVGPEPTPQAYSERGALL